MIENFEMQKKKPTAFCVVLDLDKMCLLANALAIAVIPFHTIKYFVYFD
jgi:hypothetical protein